MTYTHAPEVLVIAGSTRPTRICLKVAQWVIDQGWPDFDHDLELVDLADWPLPDDEPSIPATGDYRHEHTRAWSKKIAAAAGFVFVTPQYNWGYPAALKNALDHLYAEWSGKPATIVGYGFRGGGKAADQLRQVLGGLHLRCTSTTVALTLPSQMKADDAPVEIALEAFRSEAAQIKMAFAELDQLLKTP